MAGCGTSAAVLAVCSSVAGLSRARVHHVWRRGYAACEGAVLGVTGARRLSVAPRCAAESSSPAAGSAANAAISAFEYTHAITRRHSPRFASDAVRFNESEIQQGLAETQHAEYVRLLRTVVATVVELPPLDDHPDCVFVEDTAVVVGDTALITSMGHPSREGEQPAVAAALGDLRGASGAHLRVVRAEELVPGARVDGGDVLYTGAEMFVGISTRTTGAGVEALRAAFPGLAVHPIEVTGALHLKSLLTLCAPGVLVASDSSAGKAAAEAVVAAATVEYKVVYVGSDALANVVFANGTVLHRAESEHPGGEHAFAQVPGVRRRVEVEASEVEKADGALTCCSLLVRLP